MLLVKLTLQEEKKEEQIVSHRKAKEGEGGLMKSNWSTCIQIGDINVNEQYLQHDERYLQSLN